ncbi:MAG: HD domain-containing protein [Chlamydiales bacterium]
MKSKKVFLSLLICALSFSIIGKVSPTPVETLLEILPDHPTVRTHLYPLIDEWQKYQANENPNFDIEILIFALLYRAEKHHAQALKTTPHIIHPIEVCSILWDIGKVRNSNILVSAILHDVLEDTFTTEEEIQKSFERRICETVKEVTNDPASSLDENMQHHINHIPLMSQDARLIMLADQISTLANLRGASPSEGTKIDAYFAWGKKLLIALKGTHTGLEVVLQKEIEHHQQHLNLQPL